MFSIKQRQLEEHCHSPTSIFVYLEHLQDGLMNSSLPATLKCRRLNNLLPPPWLNWYSEYSGDPVLEIIDYIQEPLAKDLTESKAQGTVDKIVETLSIFIHHFKSNLQLADDYFAKASWAPLRNIVTDENLFWQEHEQVRRKVSLKDLKRLDCLSEDQMELLYQNKATRNVDYSATAFSELVQVSPPFCKWFQGRIQRETDLKRLAAEELIEALGKKGVIAMIAMSTEAIGSSPLEPDTETSDRLSRIFESIGLEYVEEKAISDSYLQECEQFTNRMLVDLRKYELRVRNKI
ncbi:hypothetical protein CJU89_5272 [Yarrowia sp. B02]|nr:hypothetical protein CJU89_5272 [Yarrowia sp. B02]